MKKSAVNTFSEGIISDLHPLTTPPNVLTDCLNGTIITYNGNEYVLQNDMGNGQVGTAYLDSGYVPVGMIEHGGIIYVAAYNPVENKGQIGSFPSPQRLFTGADIDTPLRLDLSNHFNSVPIYIDDSYDDGGNQVQLPLIVLEKYANKLFGQTKFYPGDKFIISTGSVVNNQQLDSIINAILDGFLRLELGVITDDGKILTLNEDNLNIKDITFSSANGYGEKNLSTFLGLAKPSADLTENEVASGIQSIEDILREGDVEASTMLQVFNSEQSGQLILTQKLNTCDTFSITRTYHLDDADNIIVTFKGEATNPYKENAFELYLKSSDNKILDWCNKDKITSGNIGYNYGKLYTNEGNPYSKNSCRIIGTEGKKFYGIMPYCRYGVVERYLKLGKIDFDAIKRNEETITDWRYFVSSTDLETGYVKINWNHSFYNLSGEEEIKSMSFRFFEITSLYDKIKGKSLGTDLLKLLAEGQIDGLDVLLNPNRVYIMTKDNYDGSFEEVLSLGTEVLERSARGNSVDDERGSYGILEYGKVYLVAITKKFTHKQYSGVHSTVIGIKLLYNSTHYNKQYRESIDLGDKSFEPINLLNINYKFKYKLENDVTGNHKYRIDSNGTLSSFLYGEGTETNIDSLIKLCEISDNTVALFGCRKEGTFLIELNNIGIYLPDSKLKTFCGEIPHNNDFLLKSDADKTVDGMCKLDDFEITIDNYEALNGNVGDANSYGYLSNTEYSNKATDINDLTQALRGRYDMITFKSKSHTNDSIRLPLVYAKHVVGCGSAIRQEKITTTQLMPYYDPFDNTGPKESQIFNYNMNSNYEATCVAIIGDNDEGKDHSTYDKVRVNFMEGTEIAREGQGRGGEPACSEANLLETCNAISTEETLAVLNFSPPTSASRMGIRSDSGAGMTPKSCGNNNSEILMGAWDGDGNDYRFCTYTLDEDGNKQWSYYGFFFLALRNSAGTFYNTEIIGPTKYNSSTVWQFPGIVCKAIFSSLLVARKFSATKTYKSSDDYSYSKAQEVTGKIRLKFKNYQNGNIIKNITDDTKILIDLVLNNNGTEYKLFDTTNKVLNIINNINLESDNTIYTKFWKEAINSMTSNIVPKWEISALDSYPISFSFGNNYGFEVESGLMSQFLNGTLTTTEFTQFDDTFKDEYCNGQDPTLMIFIADFEKKKTVVPQTGIVLYTKDINGYYKPLKSFKFYYPSDNNHVLLFDDIRKSFKTYRESNSDISPLEINNINRIHAVFDGKYANTTFWEDADEGGPPVRSIGLSTGSPLCHFNK